MRVGNEPASQGGGGSGLKGHCPACSAISGPFPKAGLLGPRVHVPLTSVFIGPLRPACGNQSPLYEDLARLH